MKTEALVAQLDRAHAYEAWGRTFESFTVRHLMMVRAGQDYANSASTIVLPELETSLASPIDPNSE